MAGPGKAGDFSYVFRVVKNNKNETFFLQMWEPFQQFGPQLWTFLKALHDHLAPDFGAGYM